MRRSCSSHCVICGYFLDRTLMDLGPAAPGLIAGYVLPVSLVYILIVRSCSEREKYSSPANMLLLCCSWANQAA